MRSPRPTPSVGVLPINRRCRCASESTTGAWPSSTCILSHVPQSVLFGFFGKIDFAVIEASRVTSDGRVYLTTSVGASPTFLQAADKVIIELNRSASAKISEMADIVIPKPPPFRPALDLDFPLQRIGKTFARVDPEKIVGIVETDAAR